MTLIISIVPNDIFVEYLRMTLIISIVPNDIFLYADSKPFYMSMKIIRVRVRVIYIDNKNVM